MSNHAFRDHLVQRQIDSVWLQRTAIEEFVDARNSGRLVAFVGSYASAHLDYPKWDDMWTSFYDILGIDDHNPIRAAAEAAMPAYDLTTLADLGELTAQADRDVDPAKFGRHRAKFLNENFSLTGTCRAHETRVSIAGTLIDTLQVQRLMTLNYDLELEWQAMTLQGDRRDRIARAKIWDGLINRGVVKKDGGRLSRKIGGRGEIISDVAVTARSDLMVEFALRQPSYETHILHLHGRVDGPRDTLVTRRDYRDRYWQDGSHRLPFNFANRLMLLASPVIFIGLGAREPDVMRTLEQYLSDNPNRRRIPTFLLWNAGPDQEQNRLRRIWFYRQYGIHLLYDDELSLLADPAYGLSTPPPADHLRMNAALHALANIAERKRNSLSLDQAMFRSPAEKYAAGKRYIALWAIEEDEPATIDLADDLVRAIECDNRIALIEGDPGTCKGSCASAIARAVAARYEERQDIDGRVISINAAFAFETDSLAAILSGGYDGKTAFEEGKCRADSVLAVKEQLFKAVVLDEGAGMTKPKRLTVIINGADRFIAHNGTALSSEIDNLIRVVLDLTMGRTAKAQAVLAKLEDAEQLASLGYVDTTFPIQMVLVGTKRVRRYLDNIQGSSCYQLFRLVRKDTKTLIQQGEQPPFVVEKASDYFSRLRQRMGSEHKWRSANDATQKRRQFYSEILDPEFLSGKGCNDPLLALEILRSLAFIGQPAEQNVLPHLPLIRSMLPKKGGARCYNQAISWLIDKKLILRVKGFRNGSPCRLGLHKTMVTQFREKHGVPLTDSRLSAGFNLSLFAAQPSDNYLPDLSWHDDLGTMVDWLLGAYRDPLFDKLMAPELKPLDWDAFFDSNPDMSFYDQSAGHHLRLGSAEIAHCIRAAVALLRGYYSVPALLMQDNRALDSILRDGPLTEHGERLHRVIRMFRDVAGVRSFMRDKLPKTTFEDYCGPEPLYADDLFWVQNEYGVVKCAQGELYRARNSFREAEMTNRNFVEFRDGGPNWLRLQLNQVQVDIERGKIVPAEERLRNIEMAINDNGRLHMEAHDAVFDHIVSTYRDYPYERERAYIKKAYPEDLILLSALALGYRGLCSHLRGALATAEDQLQCCTKMLQDLGEARAYSLFQRHLAALYAALDREDEVANALNLCVSAAGPGRQPDIDHSGRIAKIQYSSDARGTKMALVNPAERIPQLMESYRYALASDMYRLQVETAQILATVHLDNGDTDSALRYVHDAMAIAARCGFALRKITLRIVLGRIHMARREPALARSLFHSAAKLGTRIYYERAVEAAENGLVMCGKG